MLSNGDRRVVVDFIWAVLGPVAAFMGRLLLFFVCLFAWVSLLLIVLFGGIFVFAATLLGWWNPAVPAVAWMLRADYRPWALGASALFAITVFLIAQKLWRYIRRKDLLWLWP
ncbi:hypothetical protein EPO05_04635 [Patescibacteria group bacterium]|nr:MAG: hypothetical protein EPO05_04635 [Patescibacteria group bacterium]